MPVSLAVLAVLLAAGPPGAASSPPTPSNAARPVIIAYVFPRRQAIDPAGIDARKLTHINYAFANIRDGETVEGSPQDPENFKALAALRRRHPHLKILVSVGGWTWSGGFSEMAVSPEGRRRFVESAVGFVRRHDLDGLDVDWEYPGLPGNGNPHRAEDRENFTALMAELRIALDEAGSAGKRHYLLTFAAGALPDFLAHTCGCGTGSPRPRSSGTPRSGSSSATRTPTRCGSSAGMWPNTAWGA